MFVGSENRTKWTLWGLTYNFDCKIWLDIYKSQAFKGILCCAFCALLCLSL